MSTLTNSGGEGMILQNMETANISTLGINNPAFVDVLDDASDPTTPSSTTYTSTNIPQPVVNAPVSGSPPDGENTLKIPTEESKDISRLENDKEEGAHGLRVPVVDGKSNNQDARHTISTQVMGAVMAGLTHVVIGTMVGLPGVILPQMTDPESPDLYLDIKQVALFGSLIHIGAAVGSLGGGVVSMHLGQRVSLLVAMPFSLVMWLALSFTPKVWLLLLLRTVQGLAQCLIAAASNNYIAEVSESHLRGRLMGFTVVGRQSGFLLVYIIGSLDMSWRHIILVCGCVTAIPPFIGLFFLPNSPRWLVTRGRLEEARKALVFFRGPRYDSQPEFDDIVHQSKETTSNNTSFVSQLRQTREQSVLRRLLFLIFIMVLLQFNGNMSILTYVVPIFQASNSGMNSYTSAILVGSIQVAGTIVSLLVVDRLGRKYTIIVPSVICSVSMMTLGVYFYLLNQGVDVSNIGWLPLAAIMIFTAFVSAVDSSVGLLRAELLPNSVRAFATSILYIFFFASLFVVTQTFPLMVKTFGEDGVFWIYSVCSLLLALVVAMFLQETRGLSLEEIDNLFRHGKKHLMQQNDLNLSSQNIP